MKTILFDTETTDTESPQIIEAAYLELANPSSPVAVSQYYEQFKPEKPISLGAMAIHHILDEDLQDKRLHTEFALPEDLEFMIGHNIDFDWRVVGEPEVKRICTLALARHLLPDLDSHSQVALMYYFERATAKALVQSAHNALVDVRNCLVVLNHLVALTDCTTWEDLWELSEVARVPTKMPFGKHRGELMTDVPRSYLSWLLKQEDMDPYLIKAVRAAMEKK